MKKFIQISSLLSLLVLFTVASAYAQTGFGTDVNIPFAFNVGDHSYEAGNYIVKFERLATGTAKLSIQETKGDDIQTVLLNVGGGTPSGEIKLVFDTFEGRRYLTKVSTADRTFGLVGAKPGKSAVKARNVEKTEETSVIGGSANLF